MIKILVIDDEINITDAVVRAFKDIDQFQVKTTTVRLKYNEFKSMKNTNVIPIHHKFHPVETLRATSQIKTLFCVPPPIVDLRLPPACPANTPQYSP